MNAESLLTEAQIEVSRRVVDEESKKRSHLVVYLSGAHAYGFPSPDSDLDFKCIHIAPTAALVGLNAPSPTYDRAEFIGDVEVDYTSNEVGHALSGILQGNGNFLERVLGNCTLQESPELVSLRPVVQNALSRRVHRHYRGFGYSQKKELEKTSTVKKMLYVLRTTLTGTHLLNTKELVTDLTLLLDDYGFGEARELIERKKAGERTALEGDVLEKWRKEVERAFTVLDEAEAKSPLPEEPANYGEVDAWLKDLRRARFD